MPPARSPPHGRRRRGHPGVGSTRARAWLIRPYSFPAPQATTPSAGPRAAVELASGDTLHGRIAGGNGESFELELDGTGGVRLALDVAELRRVLLPDDTGRGATTEFEVRAEGDRLYRRTGGDVDITDGTFDSFTAGGVRFESRALGLKSYPWSEVAALTLEVLEELSRDPEGGGVPVALDLAAGSRLRGELVRLDGEGCRLRVAGVELPFPWGAIDELAVDDGALVYLSRLPATSEEGLGMPFGDELGQAWPHRVDRSVTGRSLRTGGVAYRSGIGAHAPTRIVWDLEPRFDSLRGFVGVDDSSLLEAQGLGSVVFRVWLDGRAVWTSPVVRAGDAAVALPTVKLEGAAQLALEADMAGDFVGDRANWLRMMLVDHSSSSR